MSGGAPLGELGRVALRQMAARRALTAIAVVGVALGVLTLVTVTSLMWGSREQFERVVLGVGADVVIRDAELSSGAQPLDARPADGPVLVHVAHAKAATRDTRIEHPQEIMDALRSMDDVVAVSPSLSAPALLRHGAGSKSIELRGIDPALEERVTPLEALVADGNWARLPTVGQGLAIGQLLAQDLGLRVGDVVELTAAGGAPLDFEVVAIFDSHIPAIDRLRAYTLLRHAQVLFGRPDTIGRINVKVRDAGDAPSVSSRVERAFGYDAESWQEANQNFLGLLEVQKRVATFILAGVLALGAFGILAVQIMLVLQKQRDIAILRATGWRRSDILAVFLLHGLGMALLGGLLGDGLAKLVVVVLGQVRVKMEGTFRADHILVADDARLYAVGLFFALVMGTLASCLPAFRASRVEPVDVLRGHIG